MPPAKNKIHLLLPFFLIFAFAPAAAAAQTIPELHEEENRLDEQILRALVLVAAPEQPKMGGVNQKCLLADQLGRRWMFKIHRDPALNTVELVSHAVGRFLGMKVPQVYPASLTVNGKSYQGTLHEWIDAAGDLEKVPPSALNEKQVSDILSYQLYDHLIVNYDVMPENFLMAKGTGEIVSIDKDYAFDRYGEAIPLRLKPAPGESYEEDYYRSVWELYLNKKTAVDFAPLLETVSYVDACDEDFLRKLIEPAFGVQHVKKYVGSVESFIERKREIPKLFSDFYAQARRERGEPEASVELPPAQVYAEKVAGLYRSRIEAKKEALSRLLQAKKGEQQPLQVSLQKRPDSGIEVLTPEQMRRILYRPDGQKK